MPYVLENILPADKEKIIADADCDKEKKNKLTHSINLKEICPNWVMDRERNYYLFLAPISTQEQTINRPYYFYFKNVFYEIRGDGWFGNRVYFDKKPLISSKLLAELQGEIKEAFKFYGRTGNGPLNEFGDPEFALIPEFNEGD